MGWLEAALGFIGLVTFMGAMLYWLPPRDPPSAEEDLAGPYREALHASVRLQRVAQDLEQQLYAEALRQAEGDQGQP
jgi:hypothetical protein